MEILPATVRLLHTLGAPAYVPNSHQYGRLTANLTLLRNLCPTDLWGTAFIDYLADPNAEQHPPEYEFLASSLHFNLLQQVLDEIYNESNP